MGMVASRKLDEGLAAALRGADNPMENPQDAANDGEATIALLVQQIWFAAMVGWSAGLHGSGKITEQVHTAARLLLAGLAATSPGAAAIAPSGPDTAS